jgi:DNA polymerase-3 subunit gamma/tau
VPRELRPHRPARMPPPSPRASSSCSSKRQGICAVQLHDQVGLVRFAPGELALKPLQPLGADFARELAAALKASPAHLAGDALSDEPASRRCRDQEKMAEERAARRVLADPNVRAVLSTPFPDASLNPYPPRR